MNEAGYGQYAGSAAYLVRANRGMAFAQAYGPWGYIGTADAVQYGFTVPVASDSLASPANLAASLPAAAQAAAGKATLAGPAPPAPGERCQYGGVGISGGTSYRPPGCHGRGSGRAPMSPWGVADRSREADDARPAKSRRWARARNR